MAEITTFEEYMAAVEYAREHNPRWRRGQAAFNVLTLTRPDLSERLRATSIDPFYDATLLPEFYQWVKENWNTTSEEA